MTNHSRINQPIFKHCVLTKFNIKLGQELQSGLKRSWLEHRIKLFSTFCYPSLRYQSCQDFTWLVLFDSHTPEVFKDIIRQYAKWSNFIPVYVDAYEMPRHAISTLLSPSVRYVITTRIDNDDALAKDYIENVQKQFSGQSFQFVNFTRGYIWNDGLIYIDEQPSNPFISLIEKRDDFKTVWCIDHTRLKEIGEIREVFSEPSWIQVVHGKNVSNRSRGVLQSPTVLKTIADRFVLNLDVKNIYWKTILRYSVHNLLVRGKEQHQRSQIGLPYVSR